MAQPELSLSQTLDLALRHQREGRFSEAEALYRQIIGKSPHPLSPQDKPVVAAALINLGAILRGSSRVDQAIELLQTAVQLAPDSAPAFNNLGNALRDALRPDEAIAIFRTAIRLNPGHAGAHNNLGNTLRDLGSLDEAIACLRTALTIEPG